MAIEANGNVHSAAPKLRRRVLERCEFARSKPSMKSCGKQIEPGSEMLSFSFLGGISRHVRWRWICLLFFFAPAYGQEINLKGAIDFHVHSSPDEVPRAIDADDLAKLAKEKGMRGLVLKNHHESTAALAYMVRKEVPGIEIFGGIALNSSVGGINLEAVKRMTMMKGGWGRVVWLPTVDSESAGQNLNAIQAR